MILQNNPKIILQGGLEGCTCNYEDGQLYEADTNIIFTANSGCKFDKTYDCTYMGDVYPMYINDEKTELVCSPSEVAGFVVSQNFIFADKIVASGGTPKPKYTVILNGTYSNCVCNYSDGEELVPNKNITLTANDGFTFNDGEYLCTKKYGNKPPDNVYMEISSDKRVLTVPIGETIDGSYALDYDYVATNPYSTGVILEISGSFTECSCNYAADSEILTNKNVEIVANEGYEFKEDYYPYTNGVVESSFSISESRDKLFIDTSQGLSPVGRQRILLGDTYVATKKVVPTPKYYVKITGVIENCTCNYANNEEIDVNKDVILTANEGYEFTGVYSYIGKSFQTYQMDISQDKKTLFISFSGVPVVDYDIKLNDNYLATQIPKSVSGFVNLYSVTDEILQNLSKVRFKGDGGNIVDYGQFIVNLYKLPLDISSVVGDNKSILLGNFDSEVLAPQILDYKYEFDLGVIKVGEKYNNVYDYINTECVLRLPFIDSVILDLEQVINQSISINCIVDLYNGSITYNVFSTFNNNIVYSETKSIFTLIPFIQKQVNGVIGSISGINNNLISIPTIEITRNIPYYTSDGVAELGKETIDYDLISTVTGYCEVTNIDLMSDATNDEKTMIEDLMKDGVYINQNINSTM